MIRPLLALALALLPLLAHAALLPGGERPVTNTPADVAAFEQSAGRIATDGNTFFAVWKDLHPYGGAEVHGGAIGSDGSRLHDTPLRVATDAAMDDAPAIAWGGGRYLVAWSTAAGEARARLIAADGTMTSPLLLGPADARGRPRIAFNGSVFLVMWLGPALQLKGTVVDPSGTLVRTFDVATAELTYPEIPLVARGSTFYFVTAKIDVNGPLGSNGYPSSVHLNPIDEHGAKGTPTLLAPATTAVFNLRADVRANEIGVGWATSIAIPGGSIVFVPVEGDRVGATQVFEASNMQLHDVVADTTGFLLVYGDDLRRRARYAGTTSEVALAVTALLATVDDAVHNGATTILLVRSNPHVSGLMPTAADLYAQKLDGTPAIPLNIAPRHQQMPDIASAGDRSLAAWNEYLGSERRLAVMAARLDASGTTLDATGIDLGVALTHVQPVRIASDGTNWLVVWTEGKTVYGRRVLRDGTRSDASKILIAENIFSPHDIGVSWDGEQYVVVFTRGIVIRGLRARVYAIRLGADGTLKLPELTLSDEDAHEAPAVGSSSADGSLIVWRKGGRLMGARLTRGGSFSPVPFASAAVVAQPAVGANGSTFLVATATSSQTTSEVQWVLVDANGVVRTPHTSWVPIATRGYGAPMLQVEAFGDGFLLYAASAAPDERDRMSEIVAARIDRNGVLVGSPFVVGSTMADYGSGFGAAGGTVVYARKIGHVVREIARVFVRTLEEIAITKRRAVR